jgi:hypothetical protein
MMILDGFGFRRAQTFALEQLIAFHCSSGDLRWAIAALALRSLSAMWAFGQERSALLVRNALGRIGQKARFAAGLTAADTMVAAGGR